MAATIALEMIGPMPGTVITLRQLSSLFASVSISSVTVSIRSSSCRQSPARSMTIRIMRVDSKSGRLARMSGSNWRRKRSPCRNDNAALQQKTAHLIDHCGSLADKARPYPVQRLQIQLFICFNWDEPRRRSLHCLGYGMGISEVILVSLSKRLSICRRDLLHIVAKRCKLSSDVVRCHACFDAN